MLNFKWLKIVISSLALFTLINNNAARCMQSDFRIGDESLEASEREAFNIDDNGLLFSYSGTNEEVVIPNEVKEIGSYVFSNRTDITSIDLPEGLLKIDDYAFSGCTNLKRVIIPDSTEIIGKFSFANCESIEYIYLGNSLCKLGEMCFFGCGSLDMINVSQENIYFSSNDGVLFDKEQINLILCPSNIRGEYFAPDTVKSIYSYAFFKCDKLEKTVFSSNLEEIKDMAFYGCSKMRNVNLGESLKHIGSCAFGDCISLGQISLPKSQRFIGNSAFFNCISLKNTSILSSNLKIERRAFAGCDNIIIYCHQGSNLERYASKHDIKFILI